MMRRCAITQPYPSADLERRQYDQTSEGTPLAGGLLEEKGVSLKFIQESLAPFRNGLRFQSNSPF